MRSAQRVSGYATLAWGTLGFNLLVIAWGAFVRATGSGAGCGSHWPLCNGEVVPRSAPVATMIEFSHRVTSGLALLLVAALVVGAWRSFPRGHVVRPAAAWSAVFIVTEALIGAGLVLLKYVADDASIARGYWVGGHLVNTFMLVAALALTAWWATNPPPARTGAARARLPFAVALGAVLLLGASGAVTALGDTLFPAASFAEGKAQTFADSAHLFVRLRVWHPVLAVIVGGALLVAAMAASTERPGVITQRFNGTLFALFAMQLAVGILNVSLLAPIPLQLIHLLLADLIWMTLVLLAAHTVAGR